jgi:hypothetical protein
MIHHNFRTCLTGHLDRGPQDLPICGAAKGQLVMLIPQGETMRLALWDGHHYEEVEVRNHNGHDVYLTARGLGGTEDQKFPRGTELFYKMTVDCVKDLVCHHDCCGDIPCPGEPVAVTGVLAPPATVGREWRGTVVFGGTGPLVLATGPRPAWLAAETGANWLALSGVPPVAGTYVVAVSGADASGGLASETVTVEASAAP